MILTASNGYQGTTLRAFYPAQRVIDHDSFFIGFVP